MVSVVEIIVQYESGGRRFEIRFKPTEIGSIMFTQEDLDRAKHGQQIAIGQVPQEVHVPAADPLPDNSAAETPEDIGLAEGVGGPELWWHTKKCDWRHLE